MDAFKGGGGWKRHPGSEASSEEEEEEEEDVQELLVDKAGQEVPGEGSGQIDQILESIIALASSFTLLQVQVHRKGMFTGRFERPVTIEGG